ncbi:hypothetical protein, partial [Faecalibaculum rodentium]|uniref:hypothetical protein n=1 Tax=Faecalibaculum rodentium TaxID=1702221 RepID=UPI00256EBA89
VPNGTLGGVRGSDDTYSIVPAAGPWTRIFPVQTEACSPKQAAAVLHTTTPSFTCSLGLD